MGRDGVVLNHENIDLRYVEQLADSEQLTCLGYLLRYMEEQEFDGRKEAGQIIERLVKKLEAEGFAAVCESGNVPGNLAMPRKTGGICMREPVSGHEVVKKKERLQ